MDHITGMQLQIERFFVTIALAACASGSPTLEMTSGAAGDACEASLGTICNPQILVSKDHNGTRTLKSITPSEYGQLFGKQFIFSHRISDRLTEEVRRAMGSNTTVLSEFESKVQRYKSDVESYKDVIPGVLPDGVNEALISALWQTSMSGGKRRAIYLARLGNLPEQLRTEKTLYGVFAADTIEPGEFIGAYVGEVKKNTEWCRQSDNAYRYFVGSKRMDYRVSLDVRWAGELTHAQKPSALDLRVYADRFQNEIAEINFRHDHPNLSSYVVYDGTHPYLVLFANRRIRPHEQLFWNYGLDYQRGRELILVDLSQTTDEPIANTLE